MDRWKSAVGDSPRGYYTGTVAGLEDLHKKALKAFNAAQSARHDAESAAHKARQAEEELQDLTLQIYAALRDARKG